MLVIKLMLLFQLSVKKIVLIIERKSKLLKLINKLSIAINNKQIGKQIRVKCRNSKYYLGKYLK